MNRLDLLIEIRIGIAAASIKIYNFPQCAQAAIVHIRSGPGYIAQCRSLECASICVNSRLMKAPGILEGAIVAHSLADVVKFAVRKKSVPRVKRMTGGPVAFLGIDEDRQPPGLLGRQRIFVAAILKAIKGRVSSEESSLKTCQCLFKAPESDVLASKCLAKHLAVRGVASEL